MTRTKEREIATAEGSASSAQRLDPALFAASFSKPAFANSTSTASHDEEEGHTKEQSRQRGKRKGGIIKDKNGESIRRLNDGRTTVRVLEKRKFEDPSMERIEEVVKRPESVDSSQSLPTAKARRFKKDRLGLKGTQDSIPSTSRALKPKSDDLKGKSKKKKSAEDPLGLEDPAFQKGGEMAHLGLSAVGKKSTGKDNNAIKKRKTMSTLRRGDAGRGGPAPSKNGIAAKFVRSS